MADDLDNILEVSRGRSVVSSEAAAGQQSGDFPALRLIAGINKVLAVVSFCLGIMGLLAMLVDESETNGLMLVATLAWTLLIPLSLWASGELILVFLCIEENTRRVAGAKNKYW